MKYTFWFFVLSLTLFTSCKYPTTGPQVGYGPAPPNFYLKQNFPNPFTDTTSVDYGIPTANNSQITITVYDRFQQEVRNLVYNNSHPPGVFVTKWDGKNSRGVKVPAGLYIIEMRGYTPQTTILRIVAIKK